MSKTFWTAVFNTLLFLFIIVVLFTTFYEDGSWVFQVDTFRVSGCLPWGICK